MYIIDDRTDAVGRTVSSAEEAQLALRRDTEGRLERALRDIFDCEHPDDAFRDDRDDDERESRTVRTLAGEMPLLGAALRAREGGARIGRRWHRWELRWDMFTERNVVDWPRSVSELRGEAALAEASIAELAAHLNATMRGELAEVLRAGARYICPESGFGDSSGDEPATAWDRFQSAGDLYALSLEEGAEAITAGAVAWEALDEWSPTGGADGDPYGVCRFGWGPLRARVRLTAGELLAVYLAGDAELTLYRGVYDYGDGPTEFVWPDQRRLCCGFEAGAGDRVAPICVNNWASPHVSGSAAWGRCRICGTTYPGALLTRRRLGDGETATLGVTETLDRLPAETLAAIARHGADALACELRW